MEPMRRYPTGDGTYAADLVAPTMVVAPVALQGRPEDMPLTSSQWGVPVGAAAPVSNAWDGGSSVDAPPPSPTYQNAVGDQSMINRSKGPTPLYGSRTVLDKQLVGDRVLGAFGQSTYMNAPGIERRDKARPAMQPAKTPMPDPNRSQSGDNTKLNFRPTSKDYGNKLAGFSASNAWDAGSSVDVPMYRPDFTKVSDPPIGAAVFLKRSGVLTPLTAPWTRSTSTAADIAALSEADITTRQNILSNINPIPADSTGIPAEMRMIDAEIERRNAGGGGGAAGGAGTVTDVATGDPVEWPADVRAIFSANDWAAMTPERRAEALDTIRHPTNATEIFKNVLDVAGITLRTWLTMDERDRREARETLDRAANTRHQMVMEDIQRQGGTATPAQSAELSSLNGGIAALLAGMNAKSKGLSTTAIVGLVAGGVVAVGLLALVLRSPRRNPSYRLPSLHGVSMRRRGR